MLSYFIRYEVHVVNWTEKKGIQCFNVIQGSYLEIGSALKSIDISIIG